MAFPKNFLWGTASSAYQIEGHPTVDGGGLSIWDEFCKQKGVIADGSDGSIACDSYHRFREDIALIKAMGLSVYRFSVSWARIDPQGDGRWNEKGFQFYESLVDTCIQEGIIPYVTLYHWELPLALQGTGGWQNRQTAFAFGRYATEVARRLKGKVTDFITLNEPQCTVLLGHGNGVHAPGLKLDLAGQFTVLHHQLLAHGLAFRAIRQEIPDAKIGLASTGRLCYPTTDADLQSAREFTFQAPDDDWHFTHNMILDPVCLGEYPENTGAELALAISKVPPEDMEIIKTPLDFIGLNIYNGNPIHDGDYQKRPQGYPITALGWPVSPDVMEWGTKFIFERYGLPIFITENGMSCHDVVSLDGAVHDPNRIDFLTRYLQGVHRAIQNGVDIRGYFHWSLTDNFEWNAGYGQRFGLVYMDYPTSTRIPKDSATWYQNLVQSEGNSIL